MASNDMQVLMYKILKYLYECMKLDKETKLEDFSYSSKLFDVPKNYWLEVISTLVAHGYIKGFKVYENKYKDYKEAFIKNAAEQYKDRIADKVYQAMINCLQVK